LLDLALSGEADLVCARRAIPKCLGPVVVEKMVATNREAKRWEQPGSPRYVGTEIRSEISLLVAAGEAREGRIIMVAIFP